LISCFPWGETWTDPEESVHVSHVSFLFSPKIPRPLTFSSIFFIIEICSGLLKSQGLIEIPATMKKMKHQVPADKIRASLVFLVFFAIFYLGLIVSPLFAAAPKGFDAGFSLPKVDFEFEKPQTAYHQQLQMIMYFAIVNMIPNIVVCTTSFIRVSVIFSFLKTSLGSSHTPSNQIWVALALIITSFIMMPVYDKMDKEAIQPFKQGKITYPQFVVKVQKPLVHFMKINTRKKDLKLFIMLSKEKEQQKLLDNPPIHLMIPAFIISELKTAFYIGFLMYLPFLCIDMITAAVLMSMGMFMLSPMGISMPLKLLTFCMIDGWELLISGFVKSYHY
jgi:flagellar biosynthesis protein FliP